MRSRLRLADVLLGAFALLLVLGVVYRAEHVHAATHKVAHAPVQVHHRKA
jgi:hypothetical protein